MTPTELVSKIEDLFDSQPGLSQLLDGIEALENELLGDPSGKALRVLRHNRTADYWERSGRPEAGEMAAYFRGMAKRP